VVVQEKRPLETKGLLIGLPPELKLNTDQIWSKKTREKIPCTGYFFFFYTVRFGFISSRIVLKEDFLRKTTFGGVAPPSKALHGVRLLVLDIFLLGI
jgi:hypothetical protein